PEGWPVTSTVTLVLPLPASVRVALPDSPLLFCGFSWTVSACAGAATATSATAIRTRHGARKRVSIGSLLRLGGYVGGSGRPGCRLPDSLARCAYPAPARVLGTGGSNMRAARVRGASRAGRHTLATRIPERTPPGRRAGAAGAAARPAGGHLGPRGVTRPAARCVAGSAGPGRRHPARVQGARGPWGPRLVS